MTYAAYLAQNAVDLGSEVDFSPLEPLFTQSRIVMLGEQDHGDGASFAFKSNLIAYLHLRCGYNVLAFEADFYGLVRAWQETREPEDIRLHIARQVYHQWSQSKETAPLWEFIEKRFETSRPLVVAGLDPRHGKLSATRILDELANLPNALQLTRRVDDYQTFRSLLAGMLEHEYDHKISPAEQKLFFSVLKDLQTVENTFQGDVWPHELCNLEYTARNSWGLGGRDEGMTANLVWLAQRYPDDKIIVWAHNYHIAKDTALIVGAEEHSRDTLLGEGAAERLADVCSLAFLSAEGWYHPEAYLGNRKHRDNLKKPPPASLEAHLYEAGLEHAFLNLHTLPGEPFLMGSVGHDTFTEARWADAYDGIFFIRTMHGLT